MMNHRAALLALAVLVTAAGGRAAAQESPPVRAGADAEIRGRLRSFYFNLAHNDWEALTADILAAKVVAHRPPPKTLVFGGAPPQTKPSVGGPRCSGSESVSIEQAVISLKDDWAEATVPHCAPVVGHDEFRLIQFDGRWRFVAIQLFRRPITMTVGR